ncbi:hypothetical protein A6043_06405 [[Haemophilus] ducreyi]|uniref:hypothetical protein n=1 Tax=Haemophilus ducreyi TaxID=730 RepID=UPI0007CDCE60|nr:hypothetical protein [[Haemophilus] ducreyi]ANF70958.1 hypothetical protein A6043_06405 [[Haemophilus] ducreyi]ANF71860.1 hypothetical protein A6044_02710 [[Haemophilus] ducreyi]
MKKYFSINIFDEDKELLLHDTLDEAKKACLDNAREQYDYACEMEDIDEYERVVDEAIYGVWENVYLQLDNRIKKMRTNLNMTI